MKKKLMSVISMLLMLIMLVTAVSVGVDALEYVTVDAPDVYEVETSFSSVKISWEYRYAPYRFLVYRSTTGKKGTWKKLTVTEEDARSYTDTSVVPGQTYYYTVKTYRKIDDFDRVYISDMSGKHKATTTIDRPEFQLVGNGGYGVVLKWDTDRDMSGVVIYRSLTGKKGTWTKIKVINNKDTNTYTDSKVNIGETYYYCYKVYKTINGKNYYSQSSKAYKSKIMDVSTPENLVLTAVKDGVKIEYSKALGTAGYVIYRSESGKKGSWSRIKVTTSNNTRKFTDTTAKKGKTYYYTVKSYKTVNGVTKYSEPAKAKKVVNDYTYPIFEFSLKEINLNSYYADQEFYFHFYNVQETDSIRIFINGTELTDELLNDEKALENLILDSNFFFYLNEDDVTGSRIELCVYRLGPGEGTLRFQHSEYDDVYAEVKVHSPETPFDKDVIKLYENYYACIDYMKEAEMVLENALTLPDGKEKAEKAMLAKDLLYEANDCLNEASKIYNSYRQQYQMYDEFRDIDIELAELNTALDDCIKAIEKRPENCENNDYIKSVHTQLHSFLKSFE